MAQLVELYRDAEAKLPVSASLATSPANPTPNTPVTLSSCVVREASAKPPAKPSTPSSPWAEQALRLRLTHLPLKK